MARAQTETTTETALTVFQEMGVTTSLGAKILDLAPNFKEMPEDEQREMITFFLRQAEKTTEGVKSRFPEIAIKHGGTVAFELPKKAGEDAGMLVREFEGVMLDQYLTKAYWRNAYGTGGRGAPDCASVDGMNPYTKDSVNAPDKGGCLTCPMNRFGSGIDEQGNPTRGKRCRDIKRAIIWMEGHELPVRIRISAANLKAFDGYMNDLRDQGLPIGSVKTRFRAKDDRNRAGVGYTGIELTTIEVLPWETIKQLKRDVIDVFEPDFRLGAIEADDFDEPNSAPSEEQQGQQSTKAKDVM